MTQAAFDPDELIAQVERQAEEAQQRAAVAQQFAADVAQLRAEARSPRGEVSLAVDTSGRLTALDLSDDALELSASELGALILKVAGSAQKRAARAAVALSEEVFGAEAGVVGELRSEFQARVGDLEDDDDPDAASGVRW